MRRASINLTANFAAQAWAILMSLAFVPIYIRILGVEQYALVGFYLALQGVFSLLDMGLSTTLNRELARTSSGGAGVHRPQDLVRTLEVVYLCIALFIGVTVGALSGPIAANWLSATQIPTPVVKQAVAFIGVLIAVQWPLSLYSGGLMGLQRQVSLRVVNSITATVKGLGAVFILVFVSPTIMAFFKWQILVGALQVAAVASLLWQGVPRAKGSPRFVPRIISGIWRFSAGLTATQVVTVILTQLPGILLSKVLSLEAYGYYVIAQGIAGGLIYLASPVFDAAFPGLSAMVAGGDSSGTSRLYHWGCQVLSFVVLPLAGCIAVYSSEIMIIWTGSPVSAANTQLLVTLLVIGSALNALMYLPYALQLANGWTRLTLYANSIAVVVLVPAVILLTPAYGAEGAAVAWIALNAGYILFIPHVMHHRILLGEKWHWYTTDVGAPLLVAAGTALAGQELVDLADGPLARLVAIGVVTLLSYAATLAVAPQPRNQLLGLLKRSAYRASC